VKSEVEFVRKDGAEKLWASGQVCSYVRSVYEGRKQAIEEMVSPRQKLRIVAGSVVDQLSPEVVSRSIEILELHNARTLSELLRGLSNDDLWTSETSAEHAARYLALEVNKDLAPLADAQRRIWSKGKHVEPLSRFYRSPIEERFDLLREWFFDNSLRSDLGEFPVKLVGKNAEIIGSELGRLLRSSKGQICREFPTATPNKEIYAKAIVEYFSHNPTRLTADVLAIVSALLSTDDRNQLESLLPQSDISSVTPSHSVTQVLSWATEKYLPFRLSQANQNNCTESERLAESFAEWILHSYPELTSFERDESPINIRTFYTVKRLAEEFWVLWVVVDGLSFLNHQELIRLITNKSTNLRASENLPLIAVLPTITEKAKYGLTTGLFPQENTSLNWDTKANFLAAFPNGVYAGNNGMTELAAGLRSETPTVCYWNYTKIDKCHHERIQLSFLKHEVDACLRSLAGHINQIVSTARDINKVAVVICSDHGQIVTPCSRIDKNPTSARVHGRTILISGRSFPYPDSPFYKGEDSETVELNPTSFRLSEPTTVALRSTYFVDRTATESEGAIGVHGGLYPEEVVVGMAVLQRRPTYKPITAVISGEGESGKAGFIRLMIDNPNSLILNPLSVFIDGLEVEKQGELLIAKVAPVETVEFEIPVTAFPQPTSGDDFEIQGKLIFEFGDGTKESCELTGKLRCRSLYKAKNPSLLDRFKK
jgi:hypothetical protein